MVDVDSAMRASAYGGGKRRKKSDEDKQKEKDDRVIEPFDPAATAKKETAEAYSMWIVIIFGLSVCLFMRYVFMDTLSGPTRVLWLLPMLLISVIPSIHRVIIPSEYYELFTMGNWFRASFLYFFSFLALSFILANPPLADIAAPTLAGGLDIETNDDVVDTRWSGGVYYIETNQDTIDVVLGMGVRDNVNAETAMMSASIWYRGEMIANLSHGAAGELDEAQQRFDEVDGNWTRGNSKGLLTKGELGPKIASRADDIGLAWEISDMQLGDYEVRISLSEEGDPWDNSWEAVYTINVVRVA
ncbi:MAG: hypothetical protein QF911_06375 [Candidatus Thalassarchaeaceae archaeon]|nr:hypothetical protein [Candidatus Thalassarchaeaceae archaeon]